VTRCGIYERPLLVVYQRIDISISDSKLRACTRLHAVQQKQGRPDQLPTLRLLCSVLLAPYTHLHNGQRRNLHHDASSICTNELQCRAATRPVINQSKNQYVYDGTYCGFLVVNVWSGAGGARMRVDCA